MKKIIFLLILIFIFTACSNTSEKKEDINQPIDVDIAWAVPAGISEAMSPFLIKNLAKEGINAKIETNFYNKNINFVDLVNYDIIVMGDLISSVILKDDDWRIVGRLNDYRVGLLVPVDSDIKTFDDLDGKLIAGNIVAAKFVKVRSGLTGLDPFSAFDFIPMEDEKIREIVLDSDGKSWGDYDAVIVADSLLAYFQEKGLGRLIDQDIITIPIMARERFITEHPEAMTSFFKVFSDTLLSFRKNMITYKKFSVAGIPDEIAAAVYTKTYQNENNFDETGKKSLRFYFNKEELDTLQETADMVFDYPVSKPRINIMDYIDLSYMEKAMKR